MPKAISRKSKALCTERAPGICNVTELIPQTLPNCVTSGRMRPPGRMRFVPDQTSGFTQAPSFLADSTQASMKARPITPSSIVG